MVEKVIARILELKSRHLVLPTVGTFVRRENGDMIFTDLIRTDDGMLISETAAMYGLPHEQARMEVAAYAASVADSLTREGRVEIEGLGTIRRSSDGVIHFMSRHTPEQDIVTESAKTDTEPTPDAIQEHKPAPSCEHTTAATPAMDGDTTPSTAKTTEQQNTYTKETGVKTVTDHDKQPDTIGHQDSDEQERPLRPHTPRYNNNSLRGALYGYRDDDNLGNTTHDLPSVTPQPASRTTAITQSAEPYKPQINIRHPQKPKKRLDAVMIIAILALAITLGILIYGYITKRGLNVTHEQELVIDPSATPVDTQSTKAE